ncbi:hypothetical protein E2562_021493 [Oryza meyeriana var. granulata]|uniref:Uncharacterized protein n=1 Tax=Oryza meyeriana var. granulata TaxID=110450 RepID=A0A6G1E0B3_9ORYZ|nr:hypothetical protein E2562_021493 [Oryza meyeriana var. granulata]
MASASALPPWVVLDRNVEDADLVDMSDHKWATVKCSTREAYGCGEFGQALVEGLTLYVRLGDGRNDRFSAHAVRATDEALRRIAPPTNPGHSLFPGHPRTTAPRITFTIYLNGAEENLLVLTAAFKSGCNVYYLLYDNIDESLIMIPSLTPPYSWFKAFPTQPILRRCSTGGYDLAVLGRASGPEGNTRRLSAYGR